MQTKYIIILLVSLGLVAAVVMFADGLFFSPSGVYGEIHEHGTPTAVSLPSNRWVVWNTGKVGNSRLLEMSSSRIRVAELASGIVLVCLSATFDFPSVSPSPATILPAVVEWAVFQNGKPSSVFASSMNHHTDACGLLNTVAGDILDVRIRSARDIRVRLYDVSLALARVGSPEE